MNTFARPFGLALSALLLAGAALAQRETTLLMGLTAEPTSLEPAINAGTAQRAVKLSVYRGLFNYGVKGKPEAELAASYTISADQKTYTVKLRKAKFQNGDPVTADDVVFTFDRIRDPKTGATFAGARCRESSGCCHGTVCAQGPHCAFPGLPGLARVGGGLA